MIMNTFGFPIIFAAVIMLTRQSPAQQVPPPGGAKQEIYEQAKSLAGVGWRGVKSYQATSEAVLTHVKKLETPGYEGKPSFAELIEMATGNDLLTQVLFKGVLRGGTSNVKDFLKLYDKIAASEDPVDLPGRNRFWANRDSMLADIGSGIVAIKSRRSLSLEEMQLISRDPQQWKMSLGIVDMDVGVKSPPASVSNLPVATLKSSKEIEVNKLSNSLDISGSEKEFRDVKDTIDWNRSNSAVVEKSKKWIFMVGAIMAFMVAAFLLKRRFSK